MTTPWVALSLMHEEDFRLAAAPLFAEGIVDAVEWSFDTLWGHAVPPWLEGLLAAYGDAGRLFGHGVHYSALSAAWEPRQDRWLDALSRELTQRPYAHVSEHYGFMTAGAFVRGAPLPMPRSEAVLRLGRDRLRRVRERLLCPLGLENLALAWNREEALAHGSFLDALLEADDFLVLDVHNLYCQAANFDLSPDALLATFPSDRVRELHVSGGSWLPAWDESSEAVRCDTHDQRVPPEVLDILRGALVRFPNVRVVVFERLGGTLSEREAAAFREDFHAVRHIVGETTSQAVGQSPRIATPETSHDGDALAPFQSALLHALVDGVDERTLRDRLARDAAMAPFREEVAAMDGRALGIASRIAKKWLRRA